jgi:segregation and condensation protein B
MEVAAPKADHAIPLTVDDFFQDAETDLRDDDADTPGGIQETM